MSAVRIEPHNSNSTRELEFQAEQSDGSASKRLFYRDFLALELKFLGNSNAARKVTQEVTRVFLDRYRSLPIVSERCKLVGPLGLEPRTKGFTSAPPFPEGVDYLFTPVGCGTL